MTFYRDGQRILKEYHRDYDQPSCRQSRCLRIRGRAYKAIIGGDYEMKLRFESTDGEKIYGMGQYQQSYLDLKGLYLRACVAQFTDFYPICGVSLGYGFCGIIRASAMSCLAETIRSGKPRPQNSSTTGLPSMTIPPKSCKTTLK